MKRFIFSCPMALATGLLLIGCTCDCLKGETAEAAVIRIENQTSAPVYLPTYCQSGPDVFIDEGSEIKIYASVLNSWTRYSCDDILENRCRENECYPDGGWIAIWPGFAYEQSWSGHLLADEPIDVPDECRADCMTPGSDVQCHRRVAAAPGQYTVMVPWHNDTTYQEFHATFTWPTTKVTVAITTPTCEGFCP